MDKVQCFSYHRNLHPKHRSRLPLKKLQSQLLCKHLQLRVLQNKKLILKKIITSLTTIFVMIRLQRKNPRNQRKNDRSLVHPIRHLLHLLMRRKKRKKQQMMRDTLMPKKMTRAQISQLKKASQE